MVGNQSASVWEWALLTPSAISPESLPMAHTRFNSLFGRIFAYTAVQCFCVRPQFSHVSENCYLSSDCHVKDVNGCFHGNGVGVIAVIENNQLFCSDDMIPSRNEGKVFNSGLDFCQRQSQFISYGRTCQGIGHHVGAGGRNDTVKTA